MVGWCGPRTLHLSCWFRNRLDLRAKAASGAPAALNQRILNIAQRDLPPPVENKLINFFNFGFLALTLRELIFLDRLSIKQETPLNPIQKEASSSDYKSLLEWATELADEADHVQALRLCFQEDGTQQAQIALKTDTSAMLRSWAQMNHSQKLMQEHQGWCVTRFQPLVRRLVASSADFEDLIATPHARREGSLQLLAESMQKHWTLLNRPISQRDLLPWLTGSPWSKALLEKMVEWGQSQKKINHAVTICAGTSEFEEALGQLSQRKGAFKEALLFCTQEPINQDRFAEVGHVMPLWIERQEQTLRVLVTDSVSELWDQPLEYPAARSGKIFQPLRYVRESLERLLPDARIFGPRTGKTRQTDHQSCGFFAWHDLCVIDRAARTQEDLWSRFAEWEGPEVEPYAPQRPLPHGMAKLSQRRWETLEQDAIVEQERLAKLKERYALNHYGPEHRISSINGTAIIKSVRLMRALLVVTSEYAEPASGHSTSV